MSQAGARPDLSDRASCAFYSSTCRGPCAHGLAGGCDRLR